MQAKQVRIPFENGVWKIAVQNGHSWFYWTINFTSRLAAQIAVQRFLGARA